MYTSAVAKVVVILIFHTSQQQNPERLPFVVVSYVINTIRSCCHNKETTNYCRQNDYGYKYRQCSVIQQRQLPYYRNNIQSRQLPQQQRNHFGILHQAIDDNDIEQENNDETNDIDSDNSIDMMRQLLENVWNIPLMGKVPTTSTNAVDECVQAMERFMNENSTENNDNTTGDSKSKNNYNTTIFYIDILLPQYDVLYKDSKVYDEVLVTEFCIQFIQQLYRQQPQLGKNAIILYKDYNTVQSIQRIITARNKEPVYKDNNDNAIEIEPTTSPTNTAFEQQQQQTSKVANDDSILYSDFDDLVVGESPIIKNENDDIEIDIDSFRKSLMKSWSNSIDDDDDDDDDNSKSETTEKIANDKNNDIKNSEERLPSQLQQQRQEKQYRILSLFNNDVQISRGVDMEEDVVRALQQNHNLLSSLEDDSMDMIIFVSAITKEEMIAIRAILTKYTNKLILFMNCKLDLPYDISRRYKFVTLYSILPLIGRVKRSDNKVAMNMNEKAPTPKVVALRRYPRNWEVYIDLGSTRRISDNMNNNNDGDDDDRIGFECIASISDEDIKLQKNQSRSSGNVRLQQQQRQQRGPSMEWIQSVVQKYIQQQQQYLQRRKQQ